MGMLIGFFIIKIKPGSDIQFSSAVTGTVIEQIDTHTGTVIISGSSAMVYLNPAWTTSVPCLFHLISKNTCTIMSGTRPYIPDMRVL